MAGAKVEREGLIAAATRLIEAMTWRSQDKAKRPYEKRVAALMRRMFARQQTAMLKQLMPKARREFVEAVLPGDLGNLLTGLLASDAATWQTALARILAQAFRDAGVALDRDVNLGPDFEMPVDRPLAIMADRAGDRITRINETTRDAVREILTTGISERKSYQQVARELRQKFREFRAPARQRHIRDRAELIAITEVGQAYVDGQLDVAARLQARGIAMEKSWLTVGDGRVSDGCRDNAAAGWLELSSAFPSGHPAPLRFPGCRCALQLRQRGVE